MLPILLSACVDEPEEKDTLPPIVDTAADDTGGGDTDTDTVPEDLGDPYLAMVAAVPAGYLLDTCTLRIDVFVDGEAFDGAEITGTGGEWVGIQLAGDQQYSASAVWQDCTELNPSGTADSGTFSGVAGNLFLFGFNGANAVYTTVTQTVDFTGGEATITVVDGADTTGLEAIAAELGVTLVNVEGTTWLATFPTDLPVGRVLAALSADDAFVEGTPTWIDAPYWW
jgi:hypothetical protein